LRRACEGLPFLSDQEDEHFARASFTFSDAQDAVGRMRQAMFNDKTAQYQDSGIRTTAGGEQVMVKPPVRYPGGQGAED